MTEIKKNASSTVQLDLFKLTIPNHLQSLFSRCLSFPCISKIRNEWSYKWINIDTAQIRILRKSFFYLGLNQVNILDNINLYALGVNNLLLRLDFFRTLLRISRLIKRKTICCTLLLTSTVHLTINYPNHYIFLFFHSLFYVPYTN